MTPELLLKTAIIPALSLLDPKLDAPAARAMLIAIALQETGLRARRQMLEARDHWWESKPGKGHGFWQLTTRLTKHPGYYGCATLPCRLFQHA